MNSKFTRIDDIEDEVEKYFKELSDFYKTDEELIQTLQKIYVLVSTDYPEFNDERGVNGRIQIYLKINERLNSFKERTNSVQIIEYIEKLIPNINSCIDHLKNIDYYYSEEDETKPRIKLDIEGLSKDSPPRFFDKHHYLIYLVPFFLWPYFSDRYKGVQEDTSPFIRFGMSYSKNAFFIKFSLLLLCIILLVVFKVIRSW